MPINEALIRNPVGYNMAVMAERLQHLLPLLDISKWQTVFDVGAMDGWEGTNLAKILPDVRIYAFEPSKANCERCTATYLAQPHAIRSRIALSAVVLSDSTGPVQFWAVDEETAKGFPGKGKVNTGIGSLLKLENPDMWPWEHNAQMSVEVQGYTMDDWCAATKVESVDAIWMDVQGAELKVLKGAEQTLRNVQVIMTEAGVKPYYQGHTLKPDIDAYLQQNGFSELVSARQQAHEYEVNAIYINRRFAQVD